MNFKEGLVFVYRPRGLKYQEYHVLYGASLRLRRTSLDFARTISCGDYLIGQTHDRAIKTKVAKQNHWEINAREVRKVISNNLRLFINVSAVSFSPNNFWKSVDI